MPRAKKNPAKEQQAKKRPLMPDEARPLQEAFNSKAKMSLKDFAAFTMPTLLWFLNSYGPSKVGYKEGKQSIEYWRQKAFEVYASFMPPIPKKKAPAASVSLVRSCFS